MKTTADTKTGLSPLGKAGEEFVRVAAIAGGIGVTILAPGIFGLWLFDESPVVQMVVRVGAFVLLVGIATFAGTLLTVLGVGIPEYFGFRSYPSLLRASAFIVSAAVAWWYGVFGILLVISAASILWRERFWKQRIAKVWGQV